MIKIITNLDIIIADLFIPAKLKKGNFRLAGILDQILEKKTSLFVEYLAQSSKRWISSAVMLPLQRVHILSLQRILSYLPVSTQVCDRL